MIAEFFIDEENNDTVKIIAACTSKEKGSEKKPVAKGVLGKTMNSRGSS